ncbi:hypothetical protein SPBR_08910 [Sporothrix brasiliensis 5110]|uniref:Uncharacterized protein n=1 Tax=Sporothrix brasiliensis 5110 TaxID=1398154 RepID=A0A0C2EKC2_9PEZI|nr:uncharacterized protein SPBR_08910 [Sporothrix brasiliensis 5110]KIH86534.1 hypothetical protein SPBR_08910 [Sporothrix brasiliensis 5110]
MNNSDTLVPETNTTGHTVSDATSHVKRDNSTGQRAVDTLNGAITDVDVSVVCETVDSGTPTDDAAKDAGLHAGSTSTLADKRIVVTRCKTPQQNFTAQVAASILSGLRTRPSHAGESGDEVDLRLIDMVLCISIPGVTLYVR